jgi:hypothetical protein
MHNHTIDPDVTHTPVTQLTCTYCHQPLTSQRIYGDSPGTGETEFRGPGNDTWCPDAGKLSTQEEWKAQIFPTYLNPAPDFSGWQYHRPVRENISDQVSRAA